MHICQIILLLTSSLLQDFTASQPTTVKVSVEKEVNILDAKIRHVYDLIAVECGAYMISRRDIPKDDPFRVKILNGVYQRLLHQLKECSKEPSRRSTTKMTTSTIMQTTPVTTKPMVSTTTEQTTTTQQTTATTTAPNQPVECQQAVNYTQSWRRDHKGSGTKPGGLYSNGGYACDLHNNLTQWFRFSGDAGTHMLDSCPKWRSCGTFYPLWTDEKMPTQIGVVNKIYIYGVWKDDCKWVLREMEVMRCSWDSQNDLIYNRLSADTKTCSEAFCGMM